MTSHTDHPLRHWDRTCPACLEEAEHENIEREHLGDPVKRTGIYAPADHPVPTPRTDAERIRILRAHISWETKFDEAIGRARQLERELTAAIERERLANMRADQAEEAATATAKETALKCAEICEARQEEGHDDGVGPAVCTDRIRVYAESLK